jgi:hypothetical protein
MFRAPSFNLPTDIQQDDDCWGRLIDILTSAEQVVTSTGRTSVPGEVSGVHPSLYEHVCSFAIHIPEPTPIHPHGIQKVVPQTTFSSHDTKFITKNPKNLQDTHEKKHGIDPFSLLPASLEGDIIDSSQNNGCSATVQSPWIPTSLSNVFSSSHLTANDNYTDTSHGTEALFGNNKATTPTSKNCFRSYQKDQWNERYQELLLFRKEYGHLFVPHSYQPSQKLSQWVKR